MYEMKYQSLKAIKLIINGKWLIANVEVIKKTGQETFETFSQFYDNMINYFTNIQVQTENHL
jgi:C4-dicarboxylate transporter